MSDTNESTASNLSNMSADSSECNILYDAPLLRAFVPKLLEDIQSKARASLCVDSEYHHASRINQIPNTNLSQTDYIQLDKANLMSNILCKGHIGRQITLRGAVTSLVQHQIEHKTDSSTAVAIRTTVQNLLQQHDRGEDIHCTQLLSDIQNALRDVNLQDMDDKFSLAVNTLIAKQCFNYIVPIGDDKSYKECQPLPELYKALKSYKII